MIETSDMNGAPAFQAARNNNNGKAYSNANTYGQYDQDSPSGLQQGRSARDAVAAGLSMAGNFQSADGPESFSHAMAYADQNLYGSQDQDDDSFGFGDVIDMINPLQHIPLVSTLYREITGDEIKPISRVIGGAVFSGGLGAAGALADVVVEEETGKDIAQNVMGFVGGSGETMHTQPPARAYDNPEIQLNQAAKDLDNDQQRQAYGDLPANVLGFTDLGYGRREVYTAEQIADGRTAGTMAQRHEEIAAPHNAPREPINHVEFAPFKGLNIEGQN